MTYCLSWELTEYQNCLPAGNELNLLIGGQVRSDLEYSELGLTNVNYVLGSVITGEMVEDPGGAG